MNHAHLDFPRVGPDHAGMDDVGLWSESHQPRPRMGHRSLPLAADWPSRRVFVPQGCDQQGRLTPTIKPAEPFPVIQDRGPEGFDTPEPVTGRESLKVWALLMAPGFVALAGGLLCWAWKTYA